MASGCGIRFTAGYERDMRYENRDMVFVALRLFLYLAMLLCFSYIAPSYY